MIKTEHIPPEGVVAAREAWLLSDRGGSEAWRAAIAAALNAWPGVQSVTEYYLVNSDHFSPAIILPLPHEKSDD